MRARIRDRFASSTTTHLGRNRTRRPRSPSQHPQPRPGRHHDTTPAPAPASALTPDASMPNRASRPARDRCRTSNRAAARRLAVVTAARRRWPGINARALASGGPARTHARPARAADPPDHSAHSPRIRALPATHSARSFRPLRDSTRPHLMLSLIRFLCVALQEEPVKGIAPVAGMIRTGRPHPQRRASSPLALR